MKNELQNVGSRDMIRELNEAPLIYQGQRCITFKFMDGLHERLEGTARKRFNDHKEKMVEGKHFFRLDQASEIRTLGLVRPQGGTPEEVTLLTERGYCLLVKSFQDDLAWEVQERLVDGYFRTAEPRSEAEVLLLYAQRLVDQERQLLTVRRDVRHLEDGVAKAQHTAEAAFHTATSNHGYFSVLGYARRNNWEMPVKEAARHGRKLTAICAGLGIEVHPLADPRFGQVNSYPESVLVDYFRDVKARN